MADTKNILPKRESVMKQTKKETETQARIRELREQINSQNKDESRPFTAYKIITYLCTLFFPLVPVALYRLWRPRTEFDRREQILWTSIILVIAAYAISLAGSF